MCITDIDLAEQNNPKLLKKNPPKHSRVAENEDAIDRTNQIAIEISQNNSPEIITVTSSGRKGRRPKHLKDYKVKVL